jgi:predicted nucleic acid-binding protein
MYLDSAILVKLVVREPDSFFYAEQIDRQTDVWSSQLAVTESWSALFRKQREGVIDAKTRWAAWRRLERYFNEGMLGLVPVDQSILKRANRIISRCYPKIALRSLDAIHLASCEAADAFPLLTNDRQMRTAADHLRFPLGPLPPSDRTRK